MDNLSSYQHHKSTANLPLHLAMRLLQVLALAAAMFIVPTLMHRIVQSLDDVYELLGRRARSPYEPAIPYTSVFIATVLLLGWHVWLGRLSYKTVVEGSGEKGRVSWGRVLGRIVVPFLLLSLGLQFVWELSAGVSDPARVVVTQ
jgi:hypothetical protein